MCTICSEYGEGDEFGRAKGVQQVEHPNHKFSMHEKFKKHKCSNETCRGPKPENKTKKQIIIKKFLKTSCFLACKKWAVQENFEDVTEFLSDLGDQGINDHFRESS